MNTKVSHGDSQGSMLGPILFTLCILPLSIIIESPPLIFTAVRMNLLFWALSVSELLYLMM